MRSRRPQRCDLSRHHRAGLGKAAEPQGDGPALPGAVNSGPPPPVRKSGVEDTPQPEDLGSGPAVCPLLRWEADAGGAQTPSGL